MLSSDFLPSLFHLYHSCLNSIVSECLINDAKGWVTYVKKYFLLQPYIFRPNSRECSFCCNSKTETVSL